jgi:DNA-binding beta-propeller fold protein YncE
MQKVARALLTALPVVASFLCSNVSAQGIITTVAGGGRTSRPALSAPLEPYGVAVDGRGNLFVASADDGIFKVASGLLTLVEGCRPPVCSALALSVASTGVIYAANPENNRVLKIDGNGASSIVGDDARNRPGILAWSVAADGAGAVYIADAGANRVRKIDPNGNMTTVAGTGTAGFSGDGDLATKAMLRFPAGVAVDAAGTPSPIFRTCASGRLIETAI